jgi:hypothetical protein
MKGRRNPIMNSNNLFKLEARGYISSIPDLLTKLKHANPQHKPVWYRGHSDAKKHKLQPTAGRRMDYCGHKIQQLAPETEREFLRRFRRRSYPYVGRILGEWEAMFVGRHHGLPTRILDWTASPLIALYFACREFLNKDGEVWAFLRTTDTSHDLDILLEKESPLEKYPKSGRRPRTSRQTDDAIKIVALSIQRHAWLPN